MDVVDSYVHTMGRGSLTLNGASQNTQFTVRPMKKMSDRQKEKEVYTAFSDAVCRKVATADRNSLAYRRPWSSRIVGEIGEYVEIQEVRVLDELDDGSVVMQFTLKVRPDGTAPRRD